MRLIAIAAGVLALGTMAGAQTESARIYGTLSGARGPLSNIEVRVKNTTTGDVTVTRTTSQGEYSVVLSPGSYDLFASPAGYITFTERQLSVLAGAAHRVDGVLRDVTNAGTPGEIFFLYARADRQPPSGPTPRTLGGTPDLSGIWLPGPDLEPEVVPLQPWAAALARERAGRVGDDPRAQCLPSGVVCTNALDLAKFVQTPAVLIMLVEGSSPGIRQVFLDGRSHPADLQPTWMGYSVGRWDGDTLVVETIGFNDKAWLDISGLPQTERLRVTERFHRRDLGHLELLITIDDPGAYTRAWTIRRLLQLAPGEEIQEYICNENNKTEHFVPAVR
jgi:hypothetical protein